MRFQVLFVSNDNVCGLEYPAAQLVEFSTAC
jgi:hypothetical protein